MPARKFWSKTVWRPDALRTLWRVRGMAFTALSAYKLRSTFVITAVALGIAALTIIVAAVDGAQRKAVEIVNIFGHDTVLVFGGNIKTRAVGQRFNTITPEDVRSVRDSLPGAYLAVPMSSKSNVPLRAGNRNYVVPTVVGSEAQYAEVWNWPLDEGRDLTDEDVKFGAKVCLIGDVPAKELFGDESPIGQTIMVQDLPVQVVGKLVYRGFSGGGGNVDDRIIMPISTLIKRFNLDRRHYRAMRVKFYDPDLMDDHKSNLESFLRDRHNIRADLDNDFSIVSADEILKFLSMIKGGLAVFLGLTSTVAMIVGGFVLANLFYLSVSERSGEIGVKKAMGARSWTIMAQFLIESVTLTMIGAILGVALGLGLGQALNRLGVLEIQLSWKVFVLSALSSVAIGIIFGLKPARKAAELDPIQALRGID